MAYARLYALNTDAVRNVKAGNLKNYLSNMRGQAKIVFDNLREHPEPRLAKEITDSIPDFKTVQEKFRVVLYYILVFKSKGIINTYEPNVNNEEENENAFAGVIPADEN